MKKLFPIPYIKPRRLLLLGSIFCVFFIACKQTRPSFDKQAFLKECGISVEELLLPPSVEDSLITESLDYLSDTPYYPLLKSYQKTKSDSIAKAICILYDSLTRAYITWDYNLEKKQLFLDLFDHFYAKAISSEKQPLDCIELTISYAGKHEKDPYINSLVNETFFSTGRISKTCYKWSREINDTLALICLCQIIPSDSTTQALKEELGYESVGLELSDTIKIEYAGKTYRVCDVISDTIHNDCRQSFLLHCAEISLQVCYNSDYYADLLFQAIKDYPYDDSDIMRILGLKLVDIKESPLFFRYKSLTKQKKYDCARELLDSLYPLKLYPLKLNVEGTSREEPFGFLPNTPIPSDSTNIFQYDNFYSIHERDCIVPFEYGRMNFLQDNPIYSKWLMQGFQECVLRSFPSGYSWRITDYLKPEHKEYSSFSLLFPLQYNNVDSRDVMNASLFIKGTSNIIYRTLYSYLKSTKDLELTDYVQNVREGRVPTKWFVSFGDSTELEDTKIADKMSEKIRLLIGNNLKEIFSECLYSYKDILLNLHETECAIEVLRVPPLDPAKDFKYKMAIMKPEEEMPIIVDLCSEEELMKQIKKHKGHYYDKRNHELYNLLWKPIEPYISNCRRVFIAMDGQTQLLNIKYLTGKGGKRIADKYDIYQLTSTKEKIRINKEENYKEMSSIALFGGLDYDMDISSSDIPQGNLLAYRGVDSTIFRSTLPPLTASKKEVVSIDSVARHFGMESILCDSLSGTEEAVKSLSHHPVSILHIATHGFYFTKNNWDKGDTFFEVASKATDPLKRCGLLFSGGQNAWLGKEIPKDREDGILTGYEISCMDLSGVDLVVLSACNTALGEISSQGVSGLQQAFKRAGVQTMIMALEPVKDEPTQVLMTEFYSLLLSGMEKHEAFNMAINTMRESSEYSHPSCWAPFIIVD